MDGGGVLVGVSVFTFGCFVLFYVLCFMFVRFIGCSVFIISFASCFLFFGLVWFGSGRFGLLFYVSVALLSLSVLTFCLFGLFPVDGSFRCPFARILARGQR